ncbi:MAG: hypothetical protein ABJA62_08695 [Luteimonas sp.]
MIAANHIQRYLVVRPVLREPLSDENPDFRENNREKPKESAPKYRVEVIRPNPRSVLVLSSSMHAIVKQGIEQGGHQGIDILWQ